MSAIDKRKALQQAQKDLDTPATQLQLALSLATRVMWMNAPAFNTVRLLPKEGLGTVAVDPYYRIYADLDIVSKWVEMAQHVSPSEPCKTCGVTKHHELAYVAGALCHEVEHPLGLHHLRALAIGARGAEWNIATDKEINDGLLDAFQWINNQTPALPRLCLPPGYVQHPKDDNQPLHLLAEEYYTLDQEKKSKEEDKDDDNPSDKEEEGGESDGDGAGQDADCGSGCDGVPRPWDEGPPTAENPGVEQGEAEAVRQQVAQNVEAARRQGYLPGSFGTWAEKALKKSQTDYLAVLKTNLRNSVNTVAGEDERDYSSISSQSWANDSDVLLPGPIDHEITIALVQDVSGSMHHALNVAKSETIKLLQQMNCRVRYYVADTEVKSASWMEDANKLKLTLGGGTDLRPAIRKAVKDNPKPGIVVVFTDGYTDHPLKHELRGSKLIYVLCGRSVSSDIPRWIKQLKVPQ